MDNFITYSNNLTMIKVSTGKGSTQSHQSPNRDKMSISQLPHRILVNLISKENPLQILPKMCSKISHHLSLLYLPTNNKLTQKRTFSTLQINGFQLPEYKIFSLNGKSKVAINLNIWTRVIKRFH